MISVRDISFNKPQSSEKIISNLSFELDSPGLHYLCGRNGSGKSVLVDLLAGALKPSKGSIYIDGFSANSTQAIANRSVCRSDVSLLGPMSVLAHLELAARARGVTVENALHIVTGLGLTDWLNEPAGNLSLGSARKCWIACSLAAVTNVNILDEPFIGLDEESSRNLSSMLTELAVDHCVLLVDHDRHVDHEVSTIRLDGADY